MKLIRQIVLGLAAAAIFICLSTFSVTEYHAENANVNSTEDRLPLAKAFLDQLSGFLSYADKIPALTLLPSAQVGTNYETQAVAQTYDKISEIAKNNPNITEGIVLPDVIVNDNPTQFTDWTDVFSRIKEALFKDWSQP